MVIREGTLLGFDIKEFFIIKKKNPEYRVQLVLVMQVPARVCSRPKPSYQGSI